MLLIDNLKKKEKLNFFRLKFFKVLTEILNIFNFNLRFNYTGLDYEFFNWLFHVLYLFIYTGIWFFYISNRVTITPRNSEGESAKEVVLTIPSEKEVVSPAQHFTVHLHSNDNKDGVSRISRMIWMPPDSSLKIDSYTLFWCKKSDSIFCDVSYYFYKVF